MMEAYDDDSDNDLLGDIPNVNENDLFGEAEEVDSGHEGGEGTEGQEAEETKTVKPVKPKRVVKNPQPKLNFETLQGPKGLIALNKLFKDFKFRGDGHEKEDLSQIMTLLEQWMYRLYPKFHFQDGLQRLESLGKKKIVQVYLQKIRSDMVERDDIVRQLDDDENDDRNDNAFNLEEDEFDQLLSQQIRSSTQPEVTLTEEELRRIKLNKKLAQERRLLKERERRERELMEVDDRQDDVETASASIDSVIE